MQPFFKDFPRTTYQEHIFTDNFKKNAHSQFSWTVCSTNCSKFFSSLILNIIDSYLLHKTKNTLFKSALTSHSYDLYSVLDNQKALKHTFQANTFKVKNFLNNFSRTGTDIWGLFYKKKNCANPVLTCKGPHWLVSLQSSSLGHSGGGAGKGEVSLQLHLWNLNSASNSPMAPRRLSCQISTNQHEVETSAHVNIHWKTCKGKCQG